MAIKMISVRCPNCGANLEFEEGRKQTFCSYCGSKIMMDNDNEFTYRYVDEAAVKRANTDEKVKMKMLETGKNVTSLKFVLAAGATLAGVLMMLLGWGLGNLSNNGDSAWYMMALLGMLVLMGCIYLWKSFYESLDESRDFGDRIKIPDISGYEKKDYSAIEALFETAGFNDIRCVPLHDLKIGLLKKDGTVESIVINGKTITGGRKRYSPDTPIIINYHSH